MPESCWSYRLLRHVNNDVTPPDFTYAVHEVFYDDNGKIWSCSQDPIELVGESESDCVIALRQIVYDITKLPAMDYDAIPEEGSVSPCCGVETRKEALDDPNQGEQEDQADSDVEVS